MKTNFTAYVMRGLLSSGLFIGYIVQDDERKLVVLSSEELSEELSTSDKLFTLSNKSEDFERIAESDSRYAGRVQLILDSATDVVRAEYREFVDSL